MSGKKKKRGKEGEAGGWRERERLQNRLQVHEAKQLWEDDRAEIVRVLITFPTVILPT